MFTCRPLYNYNTSHVDLAVPLPCIQYLNPVVIVPLLEQHYLISSDDSKYLSHPFRTDKEKKKIILTSAPTTDFDLFVDVISSEKTDSGHVYLARRIRETLEKKRNNPFSECNLVFDVFGLCCDSSLSKLSMLMFWC